MIACNSLVAQVLALHSPGCHVGASSCPIQLPVCDLGKQLRMTLETWICVGDPKKAPCFQSAQLWLL